MNLSDNVKIPHNCEICNKQLRLGNRMYLNGKYYHKKCWMNKPKTHKGVRGK